MHRFFFQAEDGIRDYKVTGVQTCALPIYRGVDRQRDEADAERLLAVFLALGLNQDVEHDHPPVPGTYVILHFRLGPLVERALQNDDSRVRGRRQLRSAAPRVASRCCPVPPGSWLTARAPDRCTGSAQCPPL